MTVIKLSGLSHLIGKLRSFMVLVLLLGSSSQATERYVTSHQLHYYFQILNQLGLSPISNGSDDPAIASVSFEWNGGNCGRGEFTLLGDHTVRYGFDLRGNLRIANRAVLSSFLYSNRLQDAIDVTIAYLSDPIARAHLRAYRQLPAVQKQAVQRMTDLILESIHQIEQGDVHQARLLMRAIPFLCQF